MGLERCPQCQAPMTDAEAGSGTCPMCSAPVARKAPVAVPKDSISQASTPNVVRSLLIAIGGTLLCCIVPVGAIFYHSWPEKPEEQQPPVAEVKPAPAKKLIAEEQKPPVLEKKAPPEVQPEPIAVKEETKKDEPAKPIKKETEPPQSKNEKKVEKPKVPAKKEAEPKKPAPVPANLANRFANVPLVGNDAIRLDGDLSDWKEITPIRLIALERGRPTKKVVQVPATQQAYLAYNQRGLLIALDVIDTSGELENAGKPEKGMWPFWDNDAVEIFIDTLNTRPKQRGDQSAHQFFAFPLGTIGADGAAGFESRILKNKLGRIDWTIASVPAGIERAGKKTPAGWTIELLLSSAVLREAAIKPGRIFGFELQIDSGTNVYYQWANDNPLVQISTNPSLWGEILFAGTDAKIDCCDGLMNPIQGFDAGGQFLVRITDLDANQDPLKKERIQATLLGKNGRLKIELEETQPSSGIFARSIETQRSASNKADVFHVSKGEVIAVEYVDALRADEKKDVTVRGAILSR